jgi:KaiC/GvpD/RAD55 family RecA-like ATPase
LTPPPIVSDLVLAVLDASSESLSLHYERVFAESSSFAVDFEIAERLREGMVEDLADQRPNADVAFPHHSISRVFNKHLVRILPSGREGKRLPRSLDKHIWSQDYDRRLKSIFPTGAAIEENIQEISDETLHRRSRASCIVQQACIKTRRVFHAEKAVTRSDARDTASVIVPSPLYIALQLLTDPDTPASEAYAVAALRSELTRRIAPARILHFTHENVSRALEVIKGRSSTSKKTRTGVDRSGGETLFILHYLAMKGVLVLEIEWSNKQPKARVDRVLSSLDNLFSLTPASKQQGLGLNVNFRLDPDYNELPSASELLNELEGLPIPIEGATSIFFGGLRFGHRGDIVAAVTGSFGTGKTTACLSIAAALAAVGCRTLFLSCEEAAADIEARLEEATPNFLSQATPLFRNIQGQDFRNRHPLRWFRAHSLQLLEQANDENVDVVLELKSLIDEAMRDASLFKPFRAQNELDSMPAFARPVIIVDGFHQLFREGGNKEVEIERSLRRLINYCKELKAVCIFTVASGEPEMHRLDFLCDIVLELTREGFDSPEQPVGRVIKVLKARRQPSLSGAHRFHISGDKGFRVKLNVAAHAEISKEMRWVEPDADNRIWLDIDIALHSKSQTLIYGTGSSGKAGLALRVLSRRPVSEKHLLRANDLFAKNSSPKMMPPYYESRTLVISFLYQAHHYKSLINKVSRKALHNDLERVLSPDRLTVDVIPLYPGQLSPEDFLAKVENKIRAAELRGLPYTGVLIDGIHNVFVQFPILQNELAFWPQLYNSLRRRGLSVATTHTEFDLLISTPDRYLSHLDFEHARRRMAPLLSVLVSSADYRLELSTVANNGLMEHRLFVRGMLDEDPRPGYGKWSRQSCKIESWQSELELQPTRPLPRDLHY